MKAEIKGENLVITIPLNPTPMPSATGKTLVVASSRGNVATTAQVNGKPVGGEWDKGNKVWLVPADKADEARRLVASAPAAPRSSGSSGYSRGSGRYFGSRFSAIRRGTCEDAPCCGCCGNF